MPELFRCGFENQMDRASQERQPDGAPQVGPISPSASWQFMGKNPVKFVFVNDPAQARSGNWCARLDLPDGLRQCDMFFRPAVPGTQQVLRIPSKTFCSMWYRFAPNWTWNTGDVDHKVILLEGSPRLYINFRATGPRSARLAALTDATNTWRNGPTFTIDNFWHHIEVQADLEANRLKIWMQGELALDTSIPLNRTQPYTEAKFGAYIGGSAPGRTMFLDDIVVSTERVGAGNELPPVNQSPTARIVATSTEGEAPLHVIFDGRSSSDPEGGALQFNWRFSDGVITGESSVSRTFDEPGTYTATLTVTDNAGNQASATATVIVRQPVPPPPGERRILLPAEVSIIGADGQEFFSRIN